MNAIDFLKHPTVKELIKDYEEIERNKRRVGYNIMTISSYTGHLENFHSDVIASLLDPFGLHDEGNTFLHLFIEFLNKHYSTDIDIGTFLNASVIREKGRLDIWIKDQISGLAIIIENKINNAPDREGQLLDYFNYSETNLLRVKSIIYLSLDGFKTAPFSSPEIQTIIKNVGAFTNQSDDLVNGWLQKCLAKCRTQESVSFLNQYIKLIQHLANKNMETTLKEKFYQFVNQDNGIATAKLVSDLTSQLGDFRAEKFAKEIGDNIMPFRKSFRYYKNYWIFENYVDGVDNFKLDVWFNNDGSANVVLWNTSLRNDLGYETVKTKLRRIDLLDQFNGESTYNGFSKNFTIDTQLSSLNVVDNAVLKFVSLLMKRLNNLNDI